MIYTGIVENGSVKLPPSWKEGTPVRVEAVDVYRTMNRLTRKLIEISANAKGLPEDFAAQHDHYLYSSSKTGVHGLR